MVEGLYSFLKSVGFKSLAVRGKDPRATLSACWLSIILPDISVCCQAQGCEACSGLLRQTGAFYPWRGVP